MDCNSLFTLKYSLSEWKELEHRKLVNPLTPEFYIYILAHPVFKM